MIPSYNIGSLTKNDPNPTERSFELNVLSGRSRFKHGASRIGDLRYGLVIWPTGEDPTTHT